MASKKALLLSYFFPPYAGGGVYRTLKFVKYLPLFGWQPTVIAPRPKQYYWAFDHSLLKEIPDSVEVQRTTSLEPFYLFALLDKVGLGKARDFLSDRVFIPDDKVGWLPFAILEALKILKSEDIRVIYTSSPPQSIHLIGYLLRKLTKKPWVADFRDQWTYNPMYQPRSETIHRVNTFLEKRVYEACDRIIHVTYSHRSAVAGNFNVPTEKIVTITNGYDGEDFRVNASSKPRGEFVIAHFGSIYMEIQRAAETFLKGMELALQKNTRFGERVKLLFFGNAAIHHKWLQHPAMKKIISIEGYVSHEKAIENMLRSDLLLLIPYGGAKDVISSKVFEYMATGKPILALCTDGDMKTLLGKANVGSFLDPADPKGIGDMLIDLFEKRERGQLTVEPHWKFIRQFERKKQTQKLSAILEELSGSLQKKRVP
jgi:glycosyltransferase involved in cell wall biosynthesis